MKNNKVKTFFIIFCTVLLLFIVGSVAYFTWSGESSSEVPYNNPKKLARLYVNSILEGDYSSVIKCLSIPQDSYINKDDIQKYFSSQSYFKNFANKSIKDIVEVGYNNYEFILKDDNNNEFKYNVDIIERTKNDYRVNEENLYYENFNFSVPIGTNVYIDGKLVDKNYIVNSDKSYDEYHFKAIVMTNKIFKLETGFGVNEYNIVPDDESNNRKFVLELNKESKEKIYKFIKDSWNKIYDEYYAKSNVSKVKYLFDESISDSTINKYFKTDMEKISKSTTSNSENINYDILEVRDGKEKNSILSSELAIIHFGYKLDWHWHLKGYNSKIRKNMTRYSAIKIRAVNGEFKIYEVLDEGLFTVNDEYLKEY